MHHPDRAAQTQRPFGRVANRLHGVIVNVETIDGVIRPTTLQPSRQVDPATEGRHAEVPRVRRLGEARDVTPLQRSRIKRVQRVGAPALGNTPGIVAATRRRGFARDDVYQFVDAHRILARRAHVVHVRRNLRPLSRVNVVRLKRSSRGVAVVVTAEHV